MYKLIFEGAELAGKSWIMSQIYNRIEPRYNTGRGLLDGCHWFNCDNGIFGSTAGVDVLKGYIDIFRALEDRNIIAEKFHITDKLYKRDNGMEQTYGDIEKDLSDLGFKVILITMPNDTGIVKSRLDDRLKLYPHYAKIMHEPQWYLDMQTRYIREVKASSLPHLIVVTDDLPNDKPITTILNWINETDGE